MMGGGIKGGEILGDFPERLDPKHNDLDVGNGRILPTRPWEAVWKAVAQWMDVEPCLQEFVVPNAKWFADNQLFSCDQLFDDACLYKDPEQDECKVATEQGNITSNE